MLIKEKGEEDDDSDRGGSRPTSPSNLLRASLEHIRSLFGQGNGSWVCLVLVILGFLLTLLDPSINLFRAVEDVEPLPNGNLYGPSVK